LLFGPPGGGKSHLAAAIGLALVENGWRVLFMRTSDLVHPRQELPMSTEAIRPLRQRMIEDMNSRKVVSDGTMSLESMIGQSQETLTVPRVTPKRVTHLPPGQLGGL